MRFLKLMLVIIMLAATATTNAETIKILWPFSPSPGYSSLLRIIERANASQTKYEFVADIKQGAGGTVAALHSLQHENNLFIMSTSSFITKPVLTPDGSHKVADYQPVYILVLNQPLVLVSKKYTLKELTAMDKPSIAIAAAGGISDFVARTVTQNNAQVIPYRSFSESKLAAAGGHTDAAVTTLGEALPLMNEGRFNLLGMTGKGPNTFQSMNINGLENLVNDNVIFAPKTMSESKVREINSILVSAGNYDDVKAPLLDDSPSFVTYNLKQTQNWYNVQTQFWNAYLKKNY